MNQGGHRARVAEPAQFQCCVLAAAGMVALKPLRSQRDRVQWRSLSA
jgi:hypothetical protein